ncbi:MBL fold metallo-hydrolase [Ktedonosporobacter rubrisoli]|uniref:MBL fold metallo-hydrolase n=1 Tax=Ktedonosporobacter rubrisoli TaxID=2509675 RepID=A0A4P6K5Q5_KTERU|nr:MBL fold metallo-hydrolase [Ktedonosporobacter rubrisoli]
MTVEQLRTWLDEGGEVCIVDVRPLAERQEWSIPGSLHIDAYEALKAHDPEALAELQIPASQRVVTVCAAGKTSQIAAKQLRARGLSQVFSLEGGMQAWSLAWNSAHIPLPDHSIQVIQIRRTGKGCLSYLIGTGEEAVVIDASLDTEVYLDVAALHGWRITHVLETHIHADHISRSRLLAQQSGAMLLLPEQKRVSFPFTAIHDEEALAIPPLHLKAFHTPGHTMESTCYLLNGHILFTGDTLFTASIGRPDLQADKGEATLRAHALYQSLHRLLALPADRLILPGHTSTPVPFDKRPLMATLHEIDAQIDLLHAERVDFVHAVLSRLPAPPPNAERIIRVNEQGLLPDQPVSELEAGANRCAIF